MTDLLRPLGAADFVTPKVRLTGPVDDDLYRAFREQLDAAPAEGLVVVELSTLGGDPDVARRMGEDIRLQTKTAPQRRLVFLGKGAVYSAGATFMGFFAAPNRYLTRGARLMIHERQLDKTLRVCGPVTACLPSVRALLHEIEAAIAMQNEGFENLIRGSQVTMAQLLEAAPSNWYLDAQEAAELGLVAGVV